MAFGWTGYPFWDQIALAAKKTTKSDDREYHQASRASVQQYEYHHAVTHACRAPLRIAVGVVHAVIGIACRRISPTKSQKC